MPRKKEREIKYPGLDAALEKLEQVREKQRAARQRIDEILVQRRNDEAARDDLMYQAQALLDGDAGALPTRDYDQELKTLWAQKAVLDKAEMLQAGRVEDEARKASHSEYARLRPRFIDRSGRCGVGPG